MKLIDHAIPSIHCLGLISLAVDVANLSVSNATFYALTVGNTAKRLTRNASMLTRLPKASWLSLLIH